MVLLMLEGPFWLPLVLLTGGRADLLCALGPCLIAALLNSQPSSCLCPSLDSAEAAVRTPHPKTLSAHSNTTFSLSRRGQVGFLKSMARPQLGAKCFSPCEMFR